MSSSSISGLSSRVSLGSQSLPPEKLSLKTKGKEADLEKSAHNLVAVLMGQFVDAMLKTLDFSCEQEVFTSFLADAVGEHIAHSGMAHNLAHSLHNQLLKSHGTFSQEKSPLTQGIQRYKIASMGQGV